MTVPPVAVSPLGVPHQDSAVTKTIDQSSPPLGPKAGGKKTENSSGQTIKIGNSKTEKVGKDSTKVGTTRSETIGDQTTKVGASKRQVKTTAITPPADAVQAPGRPTQKKLAAQPHRP